MDTNPLSPSKAQLPVVSQRLRSMAARQRAAGHDYYAAISLHNAAVISQNAGHIVDAQGLALEAVAAYEALAFKASEKYSIQTLLATTSFELEIRQEALVHEGLATSSLDAEGDVYAELAYVSAVIGERSRALDYLQRAESLDRLGRLDMEGRHQTVRARALLALPRDPRGALQMLDTLPPGTPLDLATTLSRQYSERFRCCCWVTRARLAL